jgi:hypothetical protein
MEGIPQGPCSRHFMTEIEQNRAMQAVLREQAAWALRLIFWPVGWRCKG